MPEDPLQAVCAGGTRCLGWCAWGGRILQERKQFYFKPRGPAQPRGPLCEACGDTATPVTRTPGPPTPWHQREFPLSAHGHLCRGGLRLPPSLRLLRPLSRGCLERESSRHLPLVPPGPHPGLTPRPGSGSLGGTTWNPGRVTGCQRCGAGWGALVTAGNVLHPHHLRREGLGLPDGCGPLEGAVLSTRALQL